MSPFPRACAIFGFCLVLGFGLASSLAMAQDGPTADSKHYRVEHEDDEVRVSRLTLAPYERAAPRQHLDQVVVRLPGRWQDETAPALARWEPAGASTAANDTGSSIEAVIVEFKGAESTGPLINRGPGLPGFIEQGLINNARAEVRWMQGPAGSRFERCHAHAKPTVHVHLRPSEVVGVAGPGPTRVTRGQVTVLRANTPHAWRVIGPEVADFLVIHPQLDTNTPAEGCH